MKAPTGCLRFMYLSLLACFISTAASAGSNTDIYTLLGQTPNETLWVGVSSLDTDAVNAALQSGADPNAGRPRRMMWPSLADTPLDAICDGLKDSATSLEGKIHIMDDTPGAHRSLDTLVASDKKVKAVEIAQLLLQKGGRWSKSQDFECPISVGDMELISLMLKQGVMPKNYGYYTDTQYAKMYGQEEIYKLLAAHGGALVDEHTANQLVLTNAATNSDIEIMERAISAGAQVNSPDSGGETALCAVVGISMGPFEYKTYVAIWWLLDHGAESPHWCPRDSNLAYPLSALFLELSQSSKFPEEKFLDRETINRLTKAERH